MTTSVSPAGERLLSGRTWLRIDLGRFEANAAWWIRRLSAVGSNLCAVVKSNAYGLGAVPLSQRMAKLGVPMFAVYTPGESRELIDAGITQPILIFTPMRDLQVSDALAAHVRSGQVQFALHDAVQLDQLNAVGKRLNCRVTAHLYHDTGMSRGGFDDAALAEVVARLAQTPNVRVGALYTHFACADCDADVTASQFDRFDAAWARHNDTLGPNVIRHAANTYAATRDSRYVADMARVGLGLWGYGTELLPDDDRPLPIARWITRIAQIQRLPKGAGVGYEHTCHLKRDSTLGIAPVGYSSGYPITLSNNAVVGVSPPPPPPGNADPQSTDPDKPAGYAPVIGKVNMEQLILDLTDLPWARIGCHVELISDDPHSPCAMETLAKQAQSSCYEMLCRIHPSVTRHYVAG